MSSHQLNNQHLLWRAGFGPSAEQVSALPSVSPHDVFKNLQEASQKKPMPIEGADDFLKELWGGTAKEGLQRAKDLSDAERRMIRQKQRNGLKNLNLAWMNEMVKSGAQLREKMAFFWHGHFASRNINVFYQQQLLHIIRQHALGSFRDLLHGISKSAAILNFLNAAQNKKQQPNENFAREVMELFTIGRGHYTEKDVKEAARAFTGWSANPKGNFLFRPFLHDEGSKTVLGKSGPFGGEEVLDILLEQKQTAHYITRKIYAFFVNDQVDKEKVDGLAVRFYKNDYNLAALIEDIFTADWFYDKKNIGKKIKSPVELLAGMQRMLPMEIRNRESLLLLQRVLGQVLFYPPNVAGWPGGKAWIDSSSLMMRMRIPQLITDSDELNVRPKTDDDTMAGRTDEEEMNANAGKKSLGLGKAGKPIQAHITWDAYTKHFASVQKENLVPALQSVLLQAKPRFGENLIKSFADNRDREEFIRTATLQLMSTPEYQLC